MSPWWKRQRRDDDFKAEIDAHLAHEAERLAARGLDGRIAHLAARKTFGNVGAAQERFYESSRLLWLDRLRQDVAYALRGLRQRPGFGGSIVATLAIGVGLNAAIFALLYGFLGRSLPIREPERVVSILQDPKGQLRSANGSVLRLSYPEFLTYATHTRGLVAAAAYIETSLSSPVFRAGTARGGFASCDYFRTMAVRPALGRLFVAGDCAFAGASPIVVLSYATWQSQFGGDSTVIGRGIRINNLGFTIAGVAEAGFGGIQAQAAEMWVPVTMQPALRHGRDSSFYKADMSWLLMAGRMRPGTTIPALHAEMMGVARQIDAEYARRTSSLRITPASFYERPSGNEQRIVTLLIVLAATILIMACANVANLLLARGIARRREISIRLAIGASRRRIVGQLLVESGLLGLLGALGGMGFVLAVPWAIRVFTATPGLQVDTSPDAWVLLYAFGIALVTVLLSGLIPALQTTKLDLVSAFKGQLRVGQREVRPGRLRSAVVAVELAGSTMLLVLATLLFRATVRASAIDPGYDATNLVGWSMNLDQLGYSRARARPVLDALTQRIAGAPGVINVALGDQLSSGARATFGRQADGSPRYLFINTPRVSPSYFETMRIQITRGRTFTDAETGVGGAAGSTGEYPAVITPPLASAIWPSADPIGQRFDIFGQAYYVVGVAAQTRNDGRSPAPTAYLGAPVTATARIIARTADSPAPLVRLLPEWSRQVDPQIVGRAERFEEQLARVTRPARITGAALAALGAMALVLAGVGIAGIVGYGVSQRRREVAIRMALGSTGQRVVGLMMRQGGWTVVVGLASGVACAAGAARLLRGMLFGVPALDPLTYGLVLVLLGASALGAMYLPSRQAAKVDPALTLRADS